MLYHITNLENTEATALAVHEEFMFENSGVFTFAAKHYGKRYLCQW